MLQQKTAGNLDSSEAQLLKELLYDLRLRYMWKPRMSPNAQANDILTMLR